MRLKVCGKLVMGLASIVAKAEYVGHIWPHQPGQRIDLDQPDHFDLWNADDPGRPTGGYRFSGPATEPRRRAGRAHRHPCRDGIFGRRAAVALWPAQKIDNRLLVVLDHLRSIGRNDRADPDQYAARVDAAIYDQHIPL